MQLVKNPWLDLNCIAPYVAQGDQPCIDRLSAKSSDTDYAINVNSIPEPFIGIPQRANVVLLNLNPGDGPEDVIAHADPEFRTAIFRNLRHEPQEYPFYPLNPAFAWTGAGKWWRRNLRKLIEVGHLDPKRIANKLCVIEWFPYHSVKAKLPLTGFCPSQQYSFALAKRALENKLVIGMRARSRWSAVDERLGAVPYLKNPQIGSVSPGNAGEELFQTIVLALK